MNLLGQVNIAIHWEARVAFGVLGRTVLEVVAEKAMFMMEAHFAFRALEWSLPWMDVQMSR